MLTHCFVSPSPYPLSPNNVSITEQVIEVGTHQWFYREATPDQASDCPPVLLLHGLPSHSYTWRDVMPKLAQYGLQAIAPDWVGSGFSAKPERREFPYTPDAYLQALEAFLKVLDIENCFLIVQGFLGSVGLQYALRHPDQIERLVVFNTPLSPASKLPRQMKQWGLPLIGDMLTQDPLLVDRTLEGGSGFVISDQNLEVYRKPYLTSSATGRALKATVNNINFSTSMAEIESGFSDWSKPTLLIWGMADPWLSSSAAEALSQSQSNVELFELKEAKHYPQEHWSEEVSPTIVNFLRRRN